MNRRIIYAIVFFACLSLADGQSLKKVTLLGKAEAPKLSTQPPWKGQDYPDHLLEMGTNLW